MPINIDKSLLINRIFFELKINKWLRGGVVVGVVILCVFVRTRKVFPVSKIQLKKNPSSNRLVTTDIFQFMVDDYDDDDNDGDGDGDDLV